MNRRKLLLGLALLLSLSGCAERAAGPPPVPPEPPPVPSAAAPPVKESEPGADAEPDYTDPDTCLRIFFAPYGNLIYKEEGWRSYEDLGPDALFQFAVQARYHRYMGRTNYAGLFGAEEEPLADPGPEDEPSRFPAEVIERAALDYFGAPADYMRTAVSYDAAGNDYQFQGGGLGEEWVPRVISAERDGDFVKIHYEAWYEGEKLIDSDGNQVDTPARKIYSALMTVEPNPEGGFRYRSVEPFEDPPEPKAEWSPPAEADDPTLHQFAAYRHREYLAWEKPDVPLTLDLSELANGEQEGTLSMRVPARFGLGDGGTGILSFDGGFRGGTLKVGELQCVYRLGPGETLTENKNAGKSEYAGNTMTGERWELSKTSEHVAGGMQVDDTNRFVRYIEPFTFGNSILHYVADLRDGRILTMYFYVSEDASPEDLKLYDEIVRSIHLEA